MKNINPKSLAGIQYMGIPGISSSCLNAIFRLLNFGDEIEWMKLLSNIREHSGTHFFLLSMNHGELVAITTGFSSGYAGEGPAALSTALQLFEKHGIDIDEYEVSSEVIDRVERSCLTSNDIELIRKSGPYRPTRWYDYILKVHDPLNENAISERLLRKFPQSMPFGVIDSRLYDLAINFAAQPDSSIMTGYRRLEDIVRGRTNLTESNTKLFSKAFQGESSLLYWNEVDDNGEQTGRAALFNAVYMAFRNRRAHREPDRWAGGDLQEFLMLNQLFWLEKESIPRAIE